MFTLPVALGIVALLYATVGQAGGTGYIAVMALLGLSPDIIKPTALSLNVLVAAIGTVRFALGGLLTWRSCYPFGVLGIPFSVAGGATHLPSSIYQPVVAALLLLAAGQMAWSARGAVQSDAKAPVHPPFIPSLMTGGVIGFVSGVTGVGGGIFLAPLVLTFGWANTKQVAAISVVFNLLNSASALLGSYATFPNLPEALPVWLAAVGIGGAIGSWIGLRYLSATTLRYLLALLLFGAGIRMLAF